VAITACVGALSLACDTRGDEPGCGSESFVPVEPTGCAETADDGGSGAAGGSAARDGEVVAALGCWLGVDSSVASSMISLLSVDVESSAPPELRRVVAGPVSVSVVELDTPEALDDVDESAAGGVTGPDGAGGAGSADPPEGGAAAG
jgi:hypothetical protein